MKMRRHLKCQVISNFSLVYTFMTRDRNQILVNADFLCPLSFLLDRRRRHNNNNSRSKSDNHGLVHQKSDS